MLINILICFYSGIDISAFIPKSGDELDDFENDPTAVTGKVE
jgi:hypothetical protein